MRRIIDAILILTCLAILVHDAGSGRMSVFRAVYIQENLNKGLRDAICIEEADVKTARALLSRGADANSTLDDEADTPLLHEAVQWGHREMAELLMAYGADVDTRDRGGRSPLWWAAYGYGDSKAMAESLIAKGAEVNVYAPGDETTPLHWAVWRGNRGLAELLIDHGADVNTFRYTPLHWAAHRGESAVVELLIARGADVNAEGPCGDTPLHWAIYGAHESGSVVALLIAKGAEVDARDSELFTPLHLAAGRVWKGVAELLIIKGASINAKTEEGETPLNIALKLGRADVAALLRKHGGKTGTELDQEAAK